jgi:predicted nucleotidyltransferase
VDKLERFLLRLLDHYGEAIEFVVLFGSMARGDWTIGSDYDVLVGLAVEDGKRLTDRMGEFSLLAKGNIDVFPYSCTQWRRMFTQFHPLLLDALEEGKVLYDGGAFTEMQRVFRQWRETAVVVPWRSGWKIS